MTLVFTEQGHKYFSPEQPDKKWLSATSIIGSLKEPFNREQKARDCSMRKPTVKYPNKWYGTSAEDILAAWDGESARSLELGTWYHKKREQDYRDSGYIIHWYEQEGEDKIVRSQKLQEGIYPEHMVYLDSIGICGQSDLVSVTAGKIYIDDYKTSKKIDRRSFENWEGIRKKMLKPVDHLEDCHYNHYSLQLSLYMYIMLMHNPLLLPGKMHIQHIKFEEEGVDKWDYPIYRKDGNGEYIVKDIEYIEVPYLKKEIQSIINWLKNK